MHPQQKAAWFQLIVIVGTMVLYIAAVPVLGWWFHRTIAEAAAPALGIFGLIGLTGFVPLFYRPARGGAHGGEPIMDERDLQLSRRASIAGWTTFWLLFCIVGMGTWGYLYMVRGLQYVTVHVALFPGMIGAGFVVFLLAQSVTTLHYYGWGGQQ